VTPRFVLVSHALCPYVQRAAIALAHKGVAFERRDVDLAHKPDWFLALSPLGKTPVLLVDEAPLFESAAICDYLDETLGPALHPDDPIERARERAWVAFGSALLDAIGGFYAAPDEATLERKHADIVARFTTLEQVLHAAGPWFAGDRFGMVDVVFGPVFRYFDAFETIDDFGFFDELPRVQAWREALGGHPAVRGAVDAGFPARLIAFLRNKGSALSRRMAVAA
jgi:glutathione S-transferase